MISLEIKNQEKGKMQKLLKKMTLGSICPGLKNFNGGEVEDLKQMIQQLQKIQQVKAMESRQSVQSELHNQLMQLKEMIVTLKHNAATNDTQPVVAKAATRDTNTTQHHSLMTDAPASEQIQNGLNTQCETQSLQEKHKCTYGSISEHKSARFGVLQTDSIYDSQLPTQTCTILVPEEDLAATPNVPMFAILFFYFFDISSFFFFSILLAPVQKLKKQKKIKSAPDRPDTAFTLLEEDEFFKQIIKKNWLYAMCGQWYKEEAADAKTGLSSSHFLVEKSIDSKSSLLLLSDKMDDLLVTESNQKEQSPNTPKNFTLPSSELIRKDSKKKLFSLDEKGADPDIFHLFQLNKKRLSYLQATDICINSEVMLRTDFGAD
ncbi:hypothetical protein RFI_10000 [Reticulomyxa filosa]|uniref:Uncharacterized protein n=1 Tax=Reticulomyxa filosa TaxID=46433 RepID=X6NP32_RETFI|nr:hypothetical protein RFI_10000 [Reticulomyxa filosa]|eukprot:ETO27132.1 hypothetical protein RFI_10000 [Reticulomyxa filosa]